MTPRVQRITAGLLVVLASEASAELLSVDHPDFGPGSLTLNTTQGLYWLAPSVTTGLSFVETQALLSGDARFAGFRVASLVELENLYSAAGVPDVNVPGYGALYGTEANVQGVQFLQSLTGTTYSVMVAGVTLTETAGFVGTSFVCAVNGFLSVNIGNTAIRANVQTPSGLTSFASAYTTWGSLPVGSNALGVGTWLVSAVPEPATIFTILTGLVTVALRRRRAEA